MTYSVEWKMNEIAAEGWNDDPWSVYAMRETLEEATEIYDWLRTTFDETHYRTMPLRVVERTVRIETGGQLGA
jgi:hypothetical protein